MTNKEYADFLLPGVKHTWEEYEAMYPERNLPEGAIVTRYAPSPTGLPHMGNLFQNFMSMVFANQTNGVFFLRIEDTDTSRTVENGIEKILEAISPFGINFTEGAISETEYKGEYGPYIQTQREDIYKAYAKKLIEEDKAYASFLSKEELDEIRLKQSANKERIGIYGRYAKDRNLSKEEVINRINNGESYIIRIKSPGSFFNKIKFNDLIKGMIEMPENDIDEVIIKSDGLPTYHFAHVIDDHLMHTTHVIRGDEWVSSVPKHLQLFEMLGFEPVKYAHLAPLTKNDNGTIRKLSKRLDPEATLAFYPENGIPKEAIMLYLATITNSNFEGWLDQNPDGKIEDFKFDFKKCSSSAGTLYDLPKLYNISKNYISRLTKDEVYDNALEYCDILETLDDFRRRREVVNSQVLREKQIQEEKDYYRICLSQNDIEDLQIIKDIEHKFNNKEVLHRAAFDCYVRRPLSEMQKRVLGNKKPSGIYIITYIPTGEIYIGRSTDIANRWAEHVKSAFNLGTIAHSSLHTKMEEKGIWNFSFQILEEVPKEKLNEREKYWINLYGATALLNQKQGG